MKYISESAVAWSIRELKKNTHPFFGITFLVCKQTKMPIGKTKSIRLDGLTKNHLDEHHRADPESSFYFQPFKSSKFWVSGKYPSTGLQAINTQTFSDVFLHKKGQAEWGFKESYVEKMHRISREQGYTRISLPALAIWIGKSQIWEEGSAISDVINRFLNTYNITDIELKTLFSPAEPNMDELFGTLTPTELFDDKPPKIKNLGYSFGNPPDIPMINDGTLSAIYLDSVGPAARMDLEFGNRISLIAGDNGLGKSFLLEVVWWAITGNWVTRPAMPFSKLNKKPRPKITYEIQSDFGKTSKGSSYFDWKSNTWITKKDAPKFAALCIFSRVDGSFAVADEIRGTLRSGFKGYGDYFTADEVWNGKPGTIEGLIRDWVNWQLSPDKECYNKLVQILKHLSPVDLGPLKPGMPTRIPGDPRQIPTIKHPYGEVPILFASAGVQRILLLAYVIIWTWQEHTIAASQVNEKPLQQMVIVIDEIEAHLHPQWQRSVLPALLDVGRLLNEHLNLQIVVSTHSPLILASLESDFSDDSDVLYHLALNQSEVELRPLPFHKYGDISSWLTSPVFGLRHARSKDVEQLIEKAKSVQLSPNPDVIEIKSISNQLRRLLSPDDPFWPRWTYFAERSGVSQ